MLAHHLPSSLRRPCLRSFPRLAASTSCAGQHRSLTSSLPRRAEVPETAGQEGQATGGLQQIEDMNSQTDGEGSEKGPSTYKEFMAKIGDQYRYTRSKPRNWLSPNAPFPMNPSFKPPPPISDAQKEWMFNKFFGNPLVNTPRKIAGSLNMSLKRVDAILRLKGLERQFKKAIPLQSGFQAGMEKLLGAYTHPTVLDSSTAWMPTSDPNSRSDVEQADHLERAEKRDAARYRYERLYWESTPEDGREPVLPGILEDVKKRVHLRELASKQRASRFLPKRAPRNPWIQRPPAKTFIVSRAGRVPTRFVDVGADLLNVDEIVKRGKARRHNHDLLLKRTALKKRQP